MLKNVRILTLLSFGLALAAPLAGAYSVDDGNLGSNRFDDGDFAPFDNRSEPPGFPLGFGFWTVRPGEAELWSNGIFNSNTISGPGRTIGVTNHPLAPDGGIPPRDFSVAFRYRAELPESLDFYLFFVTLRSDSLNGTGWTFIIDNEGRLHVRRNHGRAVYTPPFNPNAPFADESEPGLAETAAGAIALDAPDQYLRFWIENEFGNVVLRAKAWRGAPEDEPDTFVIDFVDDLPAPQPQIGPFGPIPFSGDAGVDFIVDYEPPLTGDETSFDTPGTFIDDFAAFGEAASGITHWELFESH